MRTAELVREFIRRGESVTLVLPNKDSYRNMLSGSNGEWQGLEVVYGEGDAIQPANVTVISKIRRMMPGVLLNVLLYLYNHELFAKYDKGVERALMKLSGKYDMLLSISYPAAIHRAVMKALSRNNRLTFGVKLAEFSDPPLRNEYSRHFFPLYHRFLHRMAHRFDYFVVPVVNAVQSYTRYIPEDRIQVIPQGFRMGSGPDAGVGGYHSNPVPTFVYAGRFYRRTRDPKLLFDYLYSLERPFRFDLYLTESDPYFDDMIGKLQKKQPGKGIGEVVIHDPVSRDELIRRLSKADFIVNMNFTYSSATPSKLIDYALAQRPVISFSPAEFSPVEFGRFLDGDYSHALPLPDPSDYDIRNVAARFIELIPDPE